MSDSSKNGNKSLLNILDQNECQLPHQLGEKFYKDVEYIMDKMSSLPEYYDVLGFDYGAPENIINLLRQSIENSK